MSSHVVRKKKFTSKKGTRKSKGTSGRSITSHARAPPRDPKVFIFNPGRSNDVIPSIYVTKLHSTYDGYFAAASFSAAGAFVDIQMVANTAYRPFAGWTTAGINWMNAVNPVGVTATNFPVLFNNTLYTQCQVLATKFSISLNPSPNAGNDGMLAAITPNVNNTAPPSTYSAAIKQPFTKTMQFRGSGRQPKPLTLFIKWAKFLGYSEKEFAQDLGHNYSTSIDPSGTVTDLSAGAKCYFTLNLNTMDCVIPTSPIPFSIQFTHYVKFYDKTDATRP